MTCRAGRFHRAFQQGREAALSLPQVSRESNPYSRRRGWPGVWRRMWDQGWVAGDVEQRETNAPRQAALDVEG